MRERRSEEREAQKSRIRRDSGLRKRAEGQDGHLKASRRGDGRAAGHEVIRAIEFVLKEIEDESRKEKEAIVVECIDLFFTA